MNRTDRIIGIGGTPEVTIPQGTRYSAWILYDGQKEAALTAMIANINNKLFRGNADASNVMMLHQPGEVNVFTSLRKTDQGSGKTPSRRRDLRLTPRLRG